MWRMDKTLIGKCNNGVCAKEPTRVLGFGAEHSRHLPSTKSWLLLKEHLIRRLILYAHRAGLRSHHQLLFFSQVFHRIYKTFIRHSYSLGKARTNGVNKGFA